MKPTKHVFQSKTMIVNGIATAVEVTNYFVPFLPPHIAAAVAIALPPINMFLRFITSTAVSFK